MRATVFHGPGDVRVEDVPDATLAADTDAVVRVTHACVCGSDLWSYRGAGTRQPGARIGHEFLGVVEEVGAAVTAVRPGDVVISPFTWSDGTCRSCLRGLHTSCRQGGFFSSPGSDGGQGEAVRVPQADGTLVVVPADVAGDAALLRRLAPLTDVLPTGHHAAVSAGVVPGATVAVVGDGAVGLCGVLAATRLGASRVVLLGRHEDRAAIGRSFGATDVVAERGEAAVAAVRALVRGGADAVLECVGTQESMDTAVGVARDGATIGYVGVPYEVSGFDLGRVFTRNVGLRGGVAPARAYIEELLVDVLAGTIDPSPVLDLTVGLEDVPAAYAAMDGRTATKALVTLSR